MVNFKTLIFIGLLMMSTMMAFSSQMWFQIWLALEINMMMFIPLVIKDSLSINCMMKYFIIQSFASSLFFFNLMMTQLTQNNTLNFNLIFLMMLLKLGMSPLHFWLPQISEGMMWAMFMLLMTWQKLIPFFILNMIKLIFLKIFILMSILFGTLGIINQSSLRKLLAFSSIIHMSWMLMIVNNNFYMWINYFMFYSFIMFSFFFLLNPLNTSSLSQCKYFYNKNQKLSMAINLMSLGGLPPLLGFFLKWMIIYNLNFNFSLLTLILMMSSFINIFIYMQISFSIFMSFNLLYSWNKNFNMNVLNTMNTLLLFFILFMMYI